MGVPWPQQRGDELTGVSIEEEQQVVHVLAIVAIVVAVLQRADVVVMVTHARHGLDAVLHGSVARQVLHHARIPLLVLHASAATTPAPWTVPAGAAPCSQ
jgi:nucleotide-binding universal stress UspA family protein